MLPIKLFIKRLVSRPLRRLSPGNVLMIHLGRCGSTVLGNLLNQHKQIDWGSELYEPIFGQWRDNNNGVEIIGEMPDDAIKILKNRSWHALHRYFGFEMKPYHFDLINYSADHFVRAIEDLRFTHFIILDRKNRLRKITSSVIAHETGGYHRKNSENKTINKVKLDVDEIKIDFAQKPLVQFLEDYDSQFDLIREVLRGKNVLELTYEDDIYESVEIAYNKVCKFLSIAPQNTKVKFHKTNPHPLRNIIENFEEVQNSLQDTSFQWMCNSD